MQAVKFKAYSSSIYHIQFVAVVDIQVFVVVDIHFAVVMVDILIAAVADWPGTLVLSVEPNIDWIKISQDDHAQYYWILKSYTDEIA